MVMNELMEVVVAMVIRPVQWWRWRWWDGGCSVGGGGGHNGHGNGEVTGFFART